MSRCKSMVCDWLTAGHFQEEGAKSRDGQWDPRVLYLGLASSPLRWAISTEISRRSLKIPDGLRRSKTSVSSLSSRGAFSPSADVETLTLAKTHPRIDPTSRVSSNANSCVENSQKRLERRSEGSCSRSQCF